MLTNNPSSRTNRRRYFCLTLVFCLQFTLTALAQQTQLGYRIDRTQQPLALSGEEETNAVPRLVRPHSGYSSRAVGPGYFLMESYYDYGSNGGVLTNLERGQDGTLAIGRMAAPSPNTADRGTYFFFHDGSMWSGYGKVENLRRGWSNIAVMNDGRSVTVSHVASEVNIDALRGFGIWSSSITGHATALVAQWPRLVVDDANTIIVCASSSTSIAGISQIKEVAISRDEGATWTHEILFPDTSNGLPQFSADDQAMASFGARVAIAAAELGGDIHLWESVDRGSTWNYRNVTNYPRDLPVGETSTRPLGTCELIFDLEGKLHLFWESVLATQDVAGTEIDLYFDRNAGIQHWSETTGAKQVVAWSNLPHAAEESDASLFVSGNPFDQVNADATLTMQPQAGVDREGGLYLLFAALRPLDYDPVDSTHYTDVYALGSADGGVSWGEVVNITDTPQSEDLWASLAKVVDDSLRFVYQSDGETGNSIQGGGAAPTNLFYHAFPKNKILLQTSKQVTLFTADTLTGFPAALLEVPVHLTLAGNRLAALGAVLKATNHRLSYQGFTPGPILPANATFTVQASAADSVRLAFVDFGSGPITRDGVLATLHFRVDKDAHAGSISELLLRELSASNDQLQAVHVRGDLGKVTIMTRAAGLALDKDLSGAPGDTIAVPVHLALSGNEISALGAVLKVNSTLLSFERFTPGDIIPGASFIAHAPAPDSVRLAYVDFGGGPLTREGMLAKLYFAISPNANVGDSVSLHFNHASATRSNFENVPLTSSSGKIAIKFTTGQIRGVLFNDLNGDGAHDTNEPGLVRRTVRLNGVALATDSLGHFNFTRIAPGRYQLSQELPSRWVQSQPQPAAYEFDLAAGATLMFEFGSWQYATLRGTVWHDRNANQKRDIDEAGLSRRQLLLSGVLANGQTLTQTLSTSRLGNYQALQLAPGQYHLSLKLPPLWTQTFPAKKSYELTLTSGLVRESLDFGALEFVIDSSAGLNKEWAENLSTIPVRFALAQNYPNPFNPQTTIAYELPHAVFVTLKVYNALGLEVATLVSGPQTPGRYEVQFTATDLPNGVYVYELRAGEFVQAKKLIVLK